MKSEKKILSVYLTPSKTIDVKATEVHGLTKNGRQLFLHGKQFSTFGHLKNFRILKKLWKKTNIDCT